MNYHLVCVMPFGSYKRGDRVEQPDQVALTLAGPNHTSFVKVAVPEADAPADEAEHAE